MMILTVRSHRHDQCLRLGVHKVDLTVLLFVMEDPRLFPIMQIIQLHSKFLMLLSSILVEGQGGNRQTLIILTI